MIILIELLSSTEFTKFILMMTYQELLLTDEWQNKRMAILKRDNFKCSKCSNQKVIDNLKGGIFNSFTFVSQTNVIDIHLMPNGGYESAGFEQKYFKCFRKDSFVYCYVKENGKHLVQGVRKMTDLEFKAYFETEDYFKSRSFVLVEKRLVLEFGDLYQNEMNLRIE